MTRRLVFLPGVEKSTKKNIHANVKEEQDLTL